MQRIAVFPILLTVIFSLLSACSGSKVLHDYDTLARFDRYRTFSFTEPRLGILRDSLLVTTALQEAVRAELTGRGLQAVDSIGDLEVVLLAGAKERVDVTNFGYSYWPDRWGLGGYLGGIESFTYPEGALIIDLVDPANEQLVWRGSAVRILKQSGKPEKITQEIRETVAEMMKDFPPGRGE